MKLWDSGLLPRYIVVSRPTLDYLLNGCQRPSDIFKTDQEDGRDLYLQFPLNVLQLNTSLPFLESKNANISTT